MATAFSQASNINQGDDSLLRGSSRMARLSDKISGLCWKAIFSGFLISLLGYWILTAIGLAFGGMGLKAFTIDDISTLSLGAVLWQTMATVVALFAGTFVAVSASRKTEADHGVVEGVVISSLFFWMMALQVGVMVMGIARGTTEIAANGVQGMVARPEVQSFFDDQLSNLQIRGDSAKVLQGIAVRFAANDFESANNYLARNSDLPKSTVDTQFASMRVRYDQVLAKIKSETGKAMSYAGWILTTLLALGALAAGLGGALAAGINRKYPKLDRLSAARSA